MKCGWPLLMMGGVVACGPAEPTLIDGSSPEAFERSIEQARRDLPDADRLIFDAAINTVPARRYADRDPAATARATFDGMTAPQVVAIEKERTRGERR